jgi:exodeoxyribonuclease V beta subunit
MTETRFKFESSPISGVNLIDASAGTGKTFTLEGIYLRLILERDLRTENILVVTYTEAATNELRDRILSKLRNSLDILTNSRINAEQEKDAFLKFLSDYYGQADTAELTKARSNLKLAVNAFDESQIFTIHGFCHRVLSDYSFESSGIFDTEILPDASQIADEVAQDYWRQLFYTNKFQSVAFLYDPYATPEKLNDLGDKISSQLRINLEPELSNENPEYWLARTDASFLKVQKMWESSRNAVKAILSDDQLLKQTSYKKDKAAERLQNIDRLITHFEYDQKVLKYFRESHLVASLKAGQKSPAHPFFILFEQFDDDVQNLFLCVKRDILLETRSRLKNQLQKLNLRSYNDLLLDLSRALQGPSAEKLMGRIRKRYQVALIDEFQDTDLVQYEIFRKIFMAAKHSVFFIGDPKQSIYQFRGADIFTYCQAKQEIESDKSAHIYHLETNYRSDKGLVDAVNYIFETTKDAFINEEIKFQTAVASHSDSRLTLDGQAESPFQMWFLKNENNSKLAVGEATQRIVNACASEIVKLLNYQNRLLLEEGERQRGIRPQDICILVRSHRQAEQMQKALYLLDVPNVLKTKSTIYQSAEFKELLMILEGIVRYQQPSRVLAALATDVIGTSGNQLFELVHQDAQWEKVAEEFHIYHQLWRDNSFFMMISHFMRQHDIRGNYFRFENGERRLTNLLHAIEVLHKAESTLKLSMPALIKWAKASGMAPSQGEGEEIRLESDDNSVKIMTIHNSKGLEFPIVFCPFSWKSGISRDVIFHREHDLVMDLGSKNQSDNKKKAQAEILAEDVRLLYVALTRARQKCYLVWGEINGAERSPLTHLLHAGKLKETGLKNGKKAQVNKDLWVEIKDWAARSDGSIQLIQLPPGKAEQYAKPGIEALTLVNRKYAGKINLTRKLSSYSSLTRKFEGDSGRRDFDAIMNQPPILGDEEAIAERFKLPKGSKTGIFFHEILEELDFKITDDSVLKNLISEKLQKYRLDEGYLETVEEIVKDTLQADLGFGLTLNRLPWEQRISEMEFYFPVKTGQVTDLVKSLGRLTSSEETNSFISTLESLDFKLVAGFMKGYIDLVFSHNNRYYILDWKTNHLGNQFENYQPDILARYINRHSYNLQFYIYALALHKYLGGKVPDYDFSTHFGGVCYLFLRGISGEGQSGIYYNDLKTSEEILVQMDHFFCQPIGGV